MKQYYEARAREYDEWYLGEGKFAARERPGWEQDVAALARALAGLAPARTLDVACGTGFLTRYLPGTITALDQSERMVAITRERLPGATVVCGEALALPFDDGAFERVVTAHFYGHLSAAEREQFLVQAWRVSVELVVVDSARRPDHDAEEWQLRVLNDGSSFQVYKRYFDAAALAAELGGGSIVYEGPWFVAVSARSPVAR
ncbi:MAG: class I SAM-dependent methyltransferase [Solirubrobacteraceae bacterium]